MITAIDMITDALRLVNVIDENETPSAEQGVSALRTLNQLMRDWEADGIRLGWVTIEELSDELQIRPMDERGIKFNLAVELAGGYGIDPLPWVAENAHKSYSRLAKGAIQHTEMSLDHLPEADAYRGMSTRSIEEG
jgi:hypothetical protein